MGDKYPPKPKDGTLPAEKPEPEANWFGVSLRPMEEFIGNGVHVDPCEPAYEEAVGKDESVMKAVRIHGYGGSEQLHLEEAEKPGIGETQVLVRIHDAGVNPIDWKIREGFLKGARHAPFPLTLGQDFSGEVVAVGERATEFRPGDRVFGFAPGSYAEYAAIDARKLAKIPEGVDDIVAASAPTPGVTAWQMLFEKADVKAGHRVLVHGAAGGVGSFAVQLAKWKGARVIGTASADDIEYLQDLGAEEVIDYRARRFENEVRDIDVVIDLVGGETLKHSYQVMKKGGVLVSSVGPVDSAQAKKHEIRAEAFLMRPDAKELADLAALMARGVIRVRVADVLLLEEAARAQELNRQGHAHGKIVLQVT